MRFITDINICNKRLLMRADFNVPIKDGVILNNFRIRAALPTIKYCLDNNVSLVIMSHLGRPNGVIDKALSLNPIADELGVMLNKNIRFSDDCVSDDSIEISKSLKSGEIHLLENLRFHPGEKQNDPDFSERLSKHGQVYINDAFGTAHRAHSSNVGVLNFMKQAACGLLLEREKKYLSNAIHKPVKPLVVILGGAKITGKIELIDNLMEYADELIIGGAMAFTFLKAKGINTGGSLVDDNKIGIAFELLKKAELKQIPVHLPSDVLAAESLDDNASWRVADVEALHYNEIGADIGPETCIEFENVLSKAGTILWNGPMGVFEMSNFSTGTQVIGRSILNCTLEGATSIIGGGDTASAVESLNIENGFSHISTGGGASLELLSGNDLPAFVALDNHE